MQHGDVVVMPLGADVMVAVAAMAVAYLGAVGVVLDSSFGAENVPVVTSHTHPRLACCVAYACRRLTPSGLRLYATQLDV